MISPSRRQSIYIAGYFDRRQELAAYGLQLIDAGYTVTSRWLYDESHSNPKPSESERDFRRRVAKTDLDDIDAADGLIFFAEEEATFRGGRHFEAGYAFKAGKEIAVVGNRENVFLWADSIDLFETWEELYHMLTL